MGRRINVQALAALVLLDKKALMDHEGIAEHWYREVEGREPNKNAEQYQRLALALRQLGYRWGITQMPDNVEKNATSKYHTRALSDKPKFLHGHTKGAWYGWRWHQKLKTARTRNGDYYTLGEQYLKKALAKIGETSTVRELKRKLDEQSQELKIYKRGEEARGRRRVLWVKTMKRASLVIVLAIVTFGFTLKAIDEDLFLKFYHEQGLARAYAYLVAELSSSEEKYIKLNELTWDLYTKGNFHDAADLADTVLTSEASSIYKARACYTLSLIALRGEQFEQARLYNRQAFKFYKRDYNQAGMNDLEIELIRITLHEGYPQQAKNDIDTIISQIGETEKIVKLYLNISLALFELSLIEENAIKLIQMTESPFSLCDAYRAMAQIGLARNDWDIAIEFLGKAQAINLEKINSPVQDEFNFLILRCYMKCRGINSSFLENLLRERAVSNGDDFLISQLNGPCPCQ